MRAFRIRPRALALVAALATGAIGSTGLVAETDGILDVILSGQPRVPQASRAPAAEPLPAPAAPRFLSQQPPRIAFRRQAAPAPRPAPELKLPRVAQSLRPVVPPRARQARQEWAKATAALPKSEGNGVKVSVSELGSRAVCVRMCDGYYVPAGDVGSSADVPAQEALCQARCPAAPVKLFTVEAGRDIEDARRGNQTYRNLPMAFAHQRSLDPTCSCERGPTQAKRVSILKDLTLKKGDVVVLDGGAKVFNGAERWPYKSRDFSDLKGSRILGIVAQKQIERVVGVTPPDTARRSLRGRGRSLDPAPASEALPEVEATRSVPAEGARKVRVIYSATDRYIAPESGTAALP